MEDKDFAKLMADDTLGIDMNNFDKQAEIDKYADLEPLGWSLAIRLYIEPKYRGPLILPDNKQENQKFENCSGLVVAIASGAYQDSRYDVTGPWCKVGDWVAFARHTGTLINYQGLPTFILHDDRPLARIKDPRDVKRI